MSWWRRVNDVLIKEPETWLAYLYGQRLNDLKHLQGAEPRYQGVVLRFLIYVYTLLRRTRMGFSPRISQATYLVYAGTRNQLSALESTVTCLRDKGQSVVVIVPKSLVDDRDSIERQDYQVMSLAISDLFRALTLTATRLLTVIRSVREMSPDLLRKRFNVFLQPHADLIYFDRLLSCAKPKYVIVSNDHNISNRSLLALARNRGCITVYMQHASVSSVFPALNVDYAFLDGMSAYETYLQCEPNQPGSDPRLESRHVILSGQKKALSRRTSSKESAAVGLAVNALDSLRDLGDFVKQMTDQGIKLKVRWHPGLGPKVVENLKSELAPYQVQYSNPRTENVNDFLNNTCALIAGNSSIHLEAALCGVSTFYYEISAADIRDYYGYAKHRLAAPAADVKQLTEMLNDVLKGTVQVDAGAVRYYSSTYGTEWEGREGELVASTLVAIDSGCELPVGVQVLDLD